MAVAVVGQTPLAVVVVGRSRHQSLTAAAAAAAADQTLQSLTLFLFVEAIFAL